MRTPIECAQLLGIRKNYWTFILPGRKMMIGPKTTAMPTMHTPLDVKAQSEEDRSSKRLSEILQIAFLLGILLHGLLISVLVARYIDPSVPKGAGMHLLKIPAMARTGVLFA